MYICAGTGVSQYVWGSEDDQKNSFFSSTMYDLEIKFKSPDFSTNIVT